MSESSGLALPLIVHWPYLLKTVIQRITWGRRLSHDSNWFTNVSGNFAVRAHVASTEKGLRVWLTLRRGWHSGEYVYSRLAVPVPENAGRRKAYRLACRQAGHLALFRYRFQP
ncbi:TPA: hypothetical protein G9F23_001708 [Salmonella enterica]|nr:hypothetical protein [Salmonella enterica]HAF4703084.1 hypothetical protein [Salmonella enterica]